MRLRLATRGSPQARTQTEAVAGALRDALGCEVELVLVETTGDRRRDVPLHVIGGQGVFVKEVQQAVLDRPRRRRRALGEGPAVSSPIPG